MLNEDTATMTNDDGQDARAPKRAKRTTSRVIRDARPGLTVERFFTREGVDPFAEVEWELRDAVISGADGKVYFEQRQVDRPTDAAECHPSRRALGPSSQRLLWRPAWAINHRHIQPSRARRTARQTKCGSTGRVASAMNGT